MATVKPESYKFGIEIEVLLRCPDKKPGKWDTLANEFSHRLSTAGIPNSVQENDSYRKWSIVRELTVQGENPYEYGIELISPIYTASSITTLSVDLQRIFAVLNTNNHYFLIPTPKCSSHVHISRTSPISPTELAGLAKAVLYFEQALNQLMPPERRNPECYWTKSNRSRDNPSLAGLSLAECLAKIDATAAATAQCSGENDRHPRPIVEVMNLYSKETNFARARGRQAHFVRGKTYRWNLAGLLTAAERSPDDMDVGNLGTIEFRQPSGSVTAEDAMAWVVLAVAFVAAAVAYGQELGGEDAEVWREEGGSMADLWEFLKAGSLVLGWDDLEVLKRLFQRAGLDVV
ncbi:hypothetical protein C8A03DRAFT_14039 [Achaetomium macrosporum]|uniref:Amidoligase enzyme n=1 Tax=Achaetomium macrosporum TaxID=79813 RepID=A0AAN7CCL4_9PEZI|nr:hypothetical protein C8A03DRAFT_14039 [Achaetomium macrosporum]